MEQVLANGVVPSNLTNDVIAFNFPRAVSALIGKVDILFIATICIRYKVLTGQCSANWLHC